MDYFNWDKFDKQRRLKLSSAAIMDFERTAGIDIVSMSFDTKATASYSNVMVFLWAVMKWEDSSLTVSAVCSLVDEFFASDKGNLPDLIKLVHEVIKSSRLYGKHNAEGGEKNGTAGVK